MRRVYPGPNILMFLCICGANINHDTELNDKIIKCKLCGINIIITEDRVQYLTDDQIHIYTT